MTTAKALTACLLFSCCAFAQQIKLPNGQKIDAHPISFCDGKDQATIEDMYINFGVRFTQANACTAAGANYQRAGYLSDAKRYWQRGCELGSPDGCRRLASQLVEEGNRREAIAILENKSWGCATAPYAGVRIGDEAYGCDLVLDDLVENTPEEPAVARRLCAGGAVGPSFCTSLIPMPTPPTDESTAAWQRSVEQLRAAWKETSDANERSQDAEMDTLSKAYDQALKGSRQSFSQALSAALGQLQKPDPIQSTANAKIGQILNSARTAPAATRSAATAASTPRPTVVPSAGNRASVGNMGSPVGMQPVSGDGTVLSQEQLAANAYRNAANGACTPEAKQCYLAQARYYDCIASALRGGSANCTQPARCTSSGCAPGQVGGNQTAYKQGTAQINNQIASQAQAAAQTHAAIASTGAIIQGGMGNNSFDSLLNSVGSSSPSSGAATSGGNAPGNYPGNSGGGGNNSFDSLLNSIGNPPVQIARNGGGGGNNSFDSLLNSIANSPAPAPSGGGNSFDSLLNSIGTNSGGACRGPVSPATGWTQTATAQFSPGVTLGCSVTVEDPCSYTQSVSLSVFNQTNQPVAVELNWTVGANVAMQPAYVKAPTVNPHLGSTIAFATVNTPDYRQRPRANACFFQNVRVGTLPGPATDTAGASTYVTPNWGPYQNSSVSFQPTPAAPDSGPVSVPPTVSFPGGQ